MRRITGIIVAMAFMLIQGLGVMGMASAAGETKTALIIVDPGMSKFSLKAAEKIGEELRGKNISARIVTAKAFCPENLKGVTLLVMGGPTYAGQPSGGLKAALSRVEKPGLRTLLFQTGGRDCAGLEPLAAMAREKGLDVAGSVKILFNQRDDGYLENQIRELLRNL